MNPRKGQKFFIKSLIYLKNNYPEIKNKELQYVVPNLPSLSATVTRDIFNSVTCSNDEQASGGEEAESISSIRENAVNNMSSQLRCVTLQDYQARIMAMPSQFGTIFRSFV